MGVNNSLKTNVIIIIMALAMLVTLGCRQMWSENQSSDANGSDGTDVSGGTGGTDSDPVVENITLQDSQGDHIDNDYLADYNEDLVVYPINVDSGDVVIDQDITWVWRPDGGAADGSDDVPLTQNPDGTITIPKEEINTGNGTVIATDSEDANQEFPVVVRQTAIALNGPTWVDINFAEAGYESSPTGLYGEYDIIELVATSAGPEPVDLTGVRWSSADPTIASVDSSANGVARIRGISLGTTTITAQAEDGTEHEHHVQVVESTFLTFWATSGSIEFPLVHITTEAQAWYTDWEYVVDWGDGSPVETLRSEDYDYNQNRYPSHSYDTAADYTIRILNQDQEIGLLAWNKRYAQMDRIAGEDPYSISNGSRGEDIVSISDVKRFGSNKMGAGMFALSNTSEGFSATGVPQLGTDLSFMFFSNIMNYDKEDISLWDVSHVENMSFMFAHTSSLTQNLGVWDVSSVKDMSYMFYWSIHFNDARHAPAGWDLDWGDKTAQVEDMSFMFAKVGTPLLPGIEGWNVSNVRDMAGMFFSPRNIDLDLSGWVLHPQVTQKNDTYSDPSYSLGYTIHPGKDVSGMFGMFHESHQFDAMSDLAKHPVGCRCELPGHEF